MAYKLDRKASPEDEFKRVGLHQLHAALAEIDDPQLPRDIVIHQVRKRCKKIRALARLYRKALGNKSYRAFNAYYRDLAAPLSGGRDAQAMLDAYDDLMEAFAGKVDRRRFSAVRRQLTLHKQALQKEAADPKVLLADARASLQAGRKAIEDVRFAAKHNDAPDATAAIEDVRFAATQGPAPPWPGRWNPGRARTSMNGASTPNITGISAGCCATIGRKPSGRGRKRPTNWGNCWARNMTCSC